MKYFVILLVLLAVVGGGGYFLYSRTNSVSPTAATVMTDFVQRRDIEKVVTANGKVASNRDVDIKCQASGTIKVLPYKDVSKEVKPGEMVCQLDPVDMQRNVVTARAAVVADEARIAEAELNRDIARMALETTRRRSEASLASAKAHAQDARAKAERTRLLYEAKPTPLASQEQLETAMTTAAQADASVLNAEAAMSELEQQKKQIDTREQSIKQLKASLDQNQSRLQIAEQNVDYCTVYAPKADNPADPPRWFIASLLTNIAPGYVVQSGTSGFSAGSTIMTLSDLSHIFVLASVDESDIGQVQDPVETDVRQAAHVTVDAYPKEQFEGQVVRVARKGVNTSNVVTFEVKIEVTSANRVLLRPEMTATAKIVNDSRPNALAVPIAAFTRGKAQTDEASKPIAAPRPDMAPATSAGSQPATGRGGGGRGRGLGRGPGGGPAAQTESNNQEGTVVVIENGAQTTRDVTVGLSDGEVFEVITGLQEGEEVLINRVSTDSRWRNQGNNRGNQLMPRTGGGGGRGR